ncbi:MAG: metalloregulator ArsR/SmtB family transcription factor [Mariprofundus sp.]|nr:metalloregulator ArsR/SmtB family transcription factor [Mariprofundus sp.]
MAESVKPPPQTDTPMQSVVFFKALADPIRLRIVHLLTRQDELCVCHFVQVLGLPQSSISRHLSTLRSAGLVSSRRDGLWIHYRLAIESDSPYAGFITELATLHQVESILADDMVRVQQISC